MRFCVLDEILILEVTHAVVALSIVFRRMHPIVEIAQTGPHREGNFL